VAGIRLCVVEQGEALAVELPELDRLAAKRLDVGQFLETAVLPEPFRAAVVGQARLR
jgi:hypothetical protein